MKRKKNVLSSIRLLLVSLLLICFLPFGLSFSDSGVRIETGSAGAGKKAALHFPFHI